MFSEVDWLQAWTHFYHLTIAFFLAVPLGWDREHRTESAGLRTFPLVALGSCAYMLTGIQVLDTSDAEARVMYGVLTGIGFIGGGAFLKGRAMSPAQQPRRVYGIPGLLEWPWLGIVTKSPWC